MKQESEPDQADWIREAMARHERGLVLYAARLLGEAERARDVVQEAFLRLCREDRTKLEGREREWLYTVTRNAALDVHKKERRMSPWTEARTEDRETNVPAPSAELEREETSSRVIAGMARLPENQREALRLKFQSGLSYAEIGRVTQQPVGTVGWLIHAGLKSLRELLGEDMREEVAS